MKAFYHQENESVTHALFIEDEFVLSFFDSVNYKYYQSTCITCHSFFFTEFIILFADQGGDRVAWSKQWIASPDIWTYRANFDSRVRTFPRTVLLPFHLMILIL